MVKKAKRTIREKKRRGKKSGVRAKRNGAKVQVKGKKKPKKGTKKLTVKLKKSRPMIGSGVRTLSSPTSRNYDAIRAALLDVRSEIPDLGDGPTPQISVADLDEHPIFGPDNGKDFECWEEPSQQAWRTGGVRKYSSGY